VESVVEQTFLTARQKVEHNKPVTAVHLTFRFLHDDLGSRFNLAIRRFPRAGARLVAIFAAQKASCDLIREH
jgi:hypothetical protein